MKKIFNFAKCIYTEYWWKEPKGVISLAVNKFLCLIIGVIYNARYYLVLNKTKKFLNNINRINKDKKVFVFANGPSLKDIDFEKVSKIKKEGYDIIVINSFISKSADRLRPDYVVFADKLHFGLKDANSCQYANDMNWCIENEVPVFIPAQYFNLVNTREKFAFNAFSNISSKNTSDITRPLGYYPLTALYALSLAKSLGYGEINLAGFDNSYFKDFSIDVANNIILHHKHYYDDEDSATTVNKKSSATSDVFFDFYRQFYFIEKITNNSDIFYNVSKKTYLNSIKRKVNLDIYY